MRVRDYLPVIILFSLFLSVYIFLAWVVSGGDQWWVIDYVSGKNIFYGDDAYRFFLARSAWTDPALYVYNFVLPANLLFEGILVLLSGHDLLVSRCFHAAISSASLCLIWHSGIVLGINRTIITCAVMIVGLMPLYALVSISFYGEAWLGACLCLVLWMFSTRRLAMASVVAGLLPLIRPEGIFFLAPLWAYMVYHRCWRESVLIILPGFLYSVSLFFLLSDFRDFISWRYEVRGILGRYLYAKDPWLLLSTYSGFLTFPALFGLLFPSVRRLWPFFVGSLLWVVFLQISISTRQSSYEPRYIFSMIPFLAIMWAASISWLWERIRLAHDGLKACAVVGLSCLVVISSFMRVNAFELAAREKGWGWTLAAMAKGDWGSIFPAHLIGYMKEYESMAEHIHVLIDKDESIDRLVMFDYFLYYFLDPERMPERLRVDYPVVPYLVSHFAMGGQVLTQHPRGRMYTYYRFDIPEYKAGEKRVLYADLLPMPNYPYRWELGAAELYLFAYSDSSESDIDLTNAPYIDPNEVLRLYNRVFFHGL